MIKALMILIAAGILGTMAPQRAEAMIGIGSVGRLSAKRAKGSTPKKKAPVVRKVIGECDSVSNKLGGSASGPDAFKTTSVKTGTGPSDLLMVVDHSGSMSSTLPGGQSKWAAVKQALSTLKSYDTKLRFGLITFESTFKLRVPVSANTISRCMSILNSLGPAGTTAMKFAFQGAQKHYQMEVIPGDSLKTRRRFVLLLTAGKSSTAHQEDLQEVARLRSLLVGGKRYDIRTFVIGLGSGIDKKQLKGLAKAGGTCTYYRAKTLAKLKRALKFIARKASR